MSDRVTKLAQRVQEHVSRIYPDIDHALLAKQLLQSMGLEHDCCDVEPHQNHWDQADSVLITYGNTIVNGDEKPLKTLHRFMNEHLQQALSSIHILPFFPFSSDDGFSVIDYLQVNPSLGDWQDISDIADDYKLMADLVINHMSSRSLWFENYKNRVQPGLDYFFEASPDDDVSEVVRPRTSPLLNEVRTKDGNRHVWCTFSPDQVDLNFSNPLVLLEFVNIIRRYLEYGVMIFRMDAVAFLWKKVGTTSIHLPQTHEIIRLLRTLIEHHTPQAVVITETNVPNRENLTYFGNANEAHVIYNFSLPPLLLYTLIKGDCHHLKTWMMSMPPAQAGTAYLNFIASHDGIGLRPLDGLLSDDEVENLVETAESFGGLVTMRQARGGHNKPYELNIALFDALQGTMRSGPDQWQLQRFICAHVIMLSLEGIPAIYLHSLLGTQNDVDRVEHTGRNRSINRHIWQEADLLAALDDTDRYHQSVFTELLRLLKIRGKQPAFHPNATQYTLHLGGCVFAFWRQSMQRHQSIFCLNNVTDTTQTMSLQEINLIGTDDWVDLIHGQHYSELNSELVLEPYQSVWLTNLRME